MCSWRNRPPRRLYREKKPQPTSPPRSHQQEYSASDDVPIWEKRFCAEIGSVPWWRIVNAKKFMFCSSDVLNWNDTAGEEAFHNAKRRYWENINRLPCDSPLPDPDVYIDEINWNPDIDPELVKELGRAYFAPNDEIKYGRENKKTKKSAPSDGYNGNKYASEKPWECNNIQVSTDTLQDGVQAWNQWDRDLRVSSHHSENPWETSYSQASATAKIMEWGHSVSGDSSWGWNREGNNTSQSKNWDNGDNSWKHGSEAVGLVSNTGWNATGDSSWGRNHFKFRNLGNGDRSWKHGSKAVGVVTNKGWNISGDSSWGRKNSGNCDSHWNRSFAQDGEGMKDQGQRGLGDGSCDWKQRDVSTREPKSLVECKRSTAG